MMETVEKSTLPAIVVGERDYEQLIDLAVAAQARAPESAGSLLFELERATVVQSDAMPPGVVRLGSTVTYQADAGEPRRVTLVLPAAADISSGRVSVLTPIGAALIGLRVGQSIAWSARDGKRHCLQVLSVRPAGDAGC